MTNWNVENMSNTNCDSCDKPDCPYSAAREAYDNYPLIHAVNSNPEWLAITDAMWRAHGVCERNKVNWRARALEAEKRIKEVAKFVAQLECCPPALDSALDDYEKGFRRGCQEMLIILCGEQ